MLRQLTTEEVEQYITDDTVRPHLSTEFRISHNREVWALYEDQYAVADEPSDHPLAIICVAYTNAIPKNELELDWFSSASGELAVSTDTAVFYTVWSYERGCGTRIVNALAQHIRNTRPEVTRWVTLSPLTDMAKRFHLKNGAVHLAVYDTDQTFKYSHLMKGTT